MLTSEMLDNLVYVRMNSMMMEKFDTSESRNLEPIYLDKLNELHEYADDEHFWDDDTFSGVDEKVIDD